ncbi:MAG: outer rane adhesin like protein [Planctomycetaceae bacterium]|nr:outer rane adhesin like protein [Planctomycetaceae bacterium]
MTDTSWNQWMNGFVLILGIKRRTTSQRMRIARIEILEDRTLLATNPIAVNDIYAVDPGTAFNGGSVLINDTDPVGTVNQAILQSGVSHGTLTLATDGTFIYTPDSGFTGSDFFTYLAEDTANSQTSLTAGRVTLHVGTSDSAPTANPVTINATTDTEFFGTLTGTDENGDPLTFAEGSTPATNGTVTISPNGSFGFTPAPGFTGVGSFSFVTTDGTVTSPDSTVTVNIGAAGPNTAPVTNPVAFVTNIDTPLNGALVGTDSNGNALTFSAGATSATNGTVVINPDGTFTFTPTTGFMGLGTFSYLATDGSLSSPESTVLVHIGIPNSLPTIAPRAVSTDTNVPYFGTLASSDANGDPVSFATGSTVAANGSVVVNPDGSYVFTPTAGFTGVGSFSFMASDSIGNTTEVTQTINVGAGLGQAPVGVPQSTFTTVNAPLTGTLQGTDTNGNNLTFSAGSAFAAHGTVLINPDGTFTYTPDPGFTGVDSFSFRTNDGTRNSQDSTVTVHVGGVNSLPTVQNTAFSTDTNAAFSGTLAGTDADGDPLTFSTGSTAATNGTVQINPDGTFVFTPTSGFAGQGTFSFNANDGIGNSTDSTATINVGTGLNQAPVGQARFFTTAVSTPVSGTLHATDINGNNLTFSAGTVSATNGTAVINSDGSFVYTPTNGFIGTDSFTFRATDGSLNSPNTTVTVQVGSANAAPTVSNGNGTTNFGTNLNGFLAPLGQDPQGNLLNFAVVTQPEHGSLTLLPDGTFTYSPDTGFSGNDSFTFKANDTTFDSNVGTFQLTVNASPSLVRLNLATTGTVATSSKSSVALDSQASLTAVDPGLSFANSTIIASFDHGGDARHDKLLLLNDHKSNVQVHGKTISIGGTRLAIISHGTDHNQLIITFNANATIDHVNAVLQRIAARTTKDSTNHVRSILMQVNAGDSSTTATIKASKAL